MIQNGVTGTVFDVDSVEMSCRTPPAVLTTLFLPIHVGAPVAGKPEAVRDVYAALPRAGFVCLLLSRLLMSGSVGFPQHGCGWTSEAHWRRVVSLEKLI